MHSRAETPTDQETYWQKKRAAKRDRKQEEVTKRLAEKQAAWEALTEAEKADRMEKFAEKKALDAESKRQNDLQVQMNTAGQWNLHIAIDFDFEGLMTDSEHKSLAQQMSYVFATCRRTQFALWPSFVGFQEETSLRSHLEKRCHQYKTWPILQTPRPLEEVYAPVLSRLIYLSPDSHYVLTDVLTGAMRYQPKRSNAKTFDLDGKVQNTAKDSYSIDFAAKWAENGGLADYGEIQIQSYADGDMESSTQKLNQKTTPIYVIGGFIDRNRYKSLTLQKAVALGIAHARLPFDICSDLSQLYAVLTINHVVDIFGKVACDGASLFDAMREVTPQRRCD